MENQTADEEAREWMQAFSTAISSNDVVGAQAMFCEESFWRDLVSFTWNIKTMEGPEAIGEMLTAVLPNTCPDNWEIRGDVVNTDGVVEAWLTFETVHVIGKGFLRLRDGKCWTLLTTAQALKGHEERVGHYRVNGVNHGVEQNRLSWGQCRERRREKLGVQEDPYVIIIGGGQGGIALAARLKLLHVPTIVLEKNERAGDSWRLRYNSLTLHDPVWYDHLPYVPFPDHWPIFTPKDMLGDWLESYVRLMDLDYWTSSECTGASYNADDQSWTVCVRREGQELKIGAKQLIFATGMSGLPNIPDITGVKDFKGKSWHSSQHAGGAAFAGQKAVIIGSNNSAHDIAADLWENNASSVTMIQRSPTTVVRSETLMEVFMEGLYSENALSRGVTTDMADLAFASMPYRILPGLHKQLSAEVQRRDTDFYERLRDAGFAFDFGEDGSGLIMKYLRRASGYYIDVGASDLVAKNCIEVEGGEIKRVTENGVEMENGTVIEADLIVFATGYGTMNGWVRQIVNDEIADRVGKVWGLGSGTEKDAGPWEGELRNMWKPTQQPGLWFHGGNLHQSRHYSQFLAIQLKARQVGINVPVYGVQEAFHKH